MHWMCTFVYLRVHLSFCWQYTKFAVVLIEFMHFFTCLNNFCTFQFANYTKNKSKNTKIWVKIYRTFNVIWTDLDFWWIDQNWSNWSILIEKWNRKNRTVCTQSMASNSESFKISNVNKQRSSHARLYCAFTHHI